jgi:filamentous hemagglutinin
VLYGIGDAATTGSNAAASTTGAAASEAAATGTTSSATQSALAGMPQSFQDEYSAAQASNWLNSNGRPLYPPNNGAVPGTILQETLPVGTELDRYGGTGDDSSFLAPAGTPIAERALLPSTNTEIINSYVVLKPLPVQASETAPWFGEPGGGTQYQTTVGSTGMTIKQLVDAGYLGEVTE